MLPLLPPPDVLQSYERVIPGFSERLLAQFERQTAHRMELERIVIRSEIRRAWWGLVAGFAIALCFLVASVYLIRGGFSVPGTLIGVVDLVALVSVFVYGSVSRRQALQSSGGLPGTKQDDAS